MIIICWHSLGFLINFRQPQDNSYLFLKKVPFAPQAVYFFAFTSIFNINFDIYFYLITKMIYIL